jgi:hypothetical protein
MASFKASFGRIFGRSLKNIVSLNLDGKMELYLGRNNDLIVI